MNPDEIFTVLESQYFGAEMHESEELALLPVLLKKHSLFVDVGASLGQYTYFADQCMQGGTIVAIEADPVRASRLEENVAQWQKDEQRNRIRVVHAALAAEPGTVTFHTTDSTTSGSLARDKIPGADGKLISSRPINVPAMTLDSVIADASSGLIKVDVEGGEFRVLQGAKHTLRSGGFEWLMEVHSWGDPLASTTPQDVFELMRENGFAKARLHAHHFFFPARGILGYPKTVLRRLFYRRLRMRS